MKKYRIEYNGKRVIRKGETADAAFAKYAENNFLSWNTRLEQIDADTHGEKWAAYWQDNGEGRKFRIMVEKI